MILELLKALFLDACVKVLRLDRDPRFIKRELEHQARHDAFMASLDDMDEEFNREFFPTYRQHISRARAERGLA